MKTSLLCSAVMFAIVAWIAPGCNPALVENEMMDQQTDQAQNELIGPDQDLSDFPPWIWPIIHPVDIVANVITNAKLSFDEAAKMVKMSASKLCECSTNGKYGFYDLLEMVEAGFDMQYTALKFAKIKAGGLYNASAKYDDDDWCGTPPKPWPWPWPWLKLIRFQAEVFVSELPQWYDLNRQELGILRDRMLKQVIRFEQLAK